jgi:lysophospholipase L1-like esterase
VNPQGCYAEYAFEYGRSSEGYPNEVIGSAGSGTSPVPVQTYSALSLQPSTSYHFRLTAWNSGDEITGGSSSFTTPAACTAPTAVTEAASFVTADKAFLNGRVDPKGCSTSYTFEYGLAGSGTYAKLTGTISGLGPLSVWKEATGLQANKLYTFRLSAANSTGKSDGSWLYFTTKTKYVALGDSYSAGTGTGTNYEPQNSGSCHRTTKAYPYLLHNAHSDWGFVNVTCQGATTSTLINTQAASLTQDTNWVTYTIGGNDAEFEGVISYCLIFDDVPCTTRINEARKIIETELPSRLDAVNNKIKSKASQAKVIVLGYPELFNEQPPCASISSALTPYKQIHFNELARILRSVVSAAAARAGSKFVFRDAIPGFENRAVCDGGSGSATEWINGVSTPAEESYHPKVAGHANVYLPLVKGITG